MTTKETDRDYIAKALDITLAFSYRGPRTYLDRNELAAWLDSGETKAPRRLLNKAARLLGIPQEA